MNMFERDRNDTNRLFVLSLVLLMAIPAMPAGAFGPGGEAGAVPRVTDDASDLIVASGEIYELFGCHTYSRSVQVNGTLKVLPYDGADDTTGTITLIAPYIIVGASGSIVADGRGYGGGGGASERSSGGGKGGTGGKGGDGDYGASWGGRRRRRQQWRQGRNSRIL